MHYYSITQQYLLQTLPPFLAVVGAHTPGMDAASAAVAAPAVAAPAVDNPVVAMTPSETAAYLADAHVLQRINLSITDAVRAQAANP